MKKVNVDNLKIKENVSISKYTTLGVGGNVKFLFKIKDFLEINKVLDFAFKNKIKVLPIGGGSNIFAQNIIKDILILKMENKGIKLLKETKSDIFYRVSSGEVWDDFVLFAVKNKLSGIEALSFIPGTVGAVPVQNVGAYGQDVSGVIDSVRIFDFKKRKFKEISSKECNFSYRNSVFKKMKNFVIESVVFRLSKLEPKVPNYPNLGVLCGEIEKRGKYSKNMVIRLAVIKTRKNKLPDPKKIRNCGSFFKNILLDKKRFGSFYKKHPEVPFFKEENMFKIPSAFLIENVGLKGFKFKKVSVYEKNSLVLINGSDLNTDSQQIFDLAEIIKNKVKEKYNLDLEIEPFILD